jgi:hypothetical protein
MSVESFAPGFKTPEFVAALKALILGSKYLCRDVVLHHDELALYRVGTFFREASLFDCTAHFGGIVGNTRMMVITSSPRGLGQLSARPEWGLAVLGPNELFKVLDIQTLKDKTQITVAHVPVAFEAYFRSSDAWLFDKWTVPQAQEDFREALEMKAIGVHLEEEWRRRVERPPGMSSERRLAAA